jgi:signal transduction histidine kinase
MRFEPIDLRTLLLESVELHRQTSALHSLSIEIGEGDYAILGDPLRIAQVFNNLVNNAIKYSPQGGLVKVGLSAYEDKVEVVVEDEGIGIQPFEMASLFQPFHRAENALSIPGVGLGLSTSQKIVRAHRGEIRVEGKNGKGTRFIIVLPRNPADEREVPTYQKSHAREADFDLERDRFQQ